MIDSIRHFVHTKILGAEPDTHPSGVPGVELAACALLLELAYADQEFSEEERRHILNALERHFGLEEPAARELIQLAEAKRREAIDDFQFTRLIAERYDLGQKMVLAEVMWGVILADGKITDHEAWLVRKLGHLLDLQPAYLAQARKAANQGTEPL